MKVASLARECPFHDRTITVTNCGRICIGRRRINLSIVFAGQNVGIKEVSEKVWLVSFMQYDLDFFDHETDRVTSAENPFGAKVLPMCSGRYVIGGKGGTRNLARTNADQQVTDSENNSAPTGPPKSP